MSSTIEDMPFILHGKRAHEEGPKSHHHRSIAEEYCNFTFAKVKNNVKNTFVKVNYFISLHFEKVNKNDAGRLSTA